MYVCVYEWSIHFGQFWKKGRNEYEIFDGYIGVNKTSKNSFSTFSKDTVSMYEFSAGGKL